MRPCSSPRCASVARLIPRVCSLLPSATEIVGALGRTDWLVGRSEECDFPADVAGLPVVTASRVDTTTLSSRDIDAAVRDAVLSGRALYAVDEELIRELRPDIVITQDLCHVCAVSGDDVRRIRSLDAEVISLDPRTIADVEATVVRLGERLDASDAAAAVVGRMRQTIAAAAEAVAGRPPVPVFVAEWLDPPFAPGHWVPEMVALAGGREVLGRSGGPSFPVTWDDVAAADPNVVVVAPCGFGAERAAAESAGIRFTCRALAVEADSYYSRPAPRLADGVAQLAHILHPTVAPDPGLPAITLEAAVA
jgi:iron complex transport system substrate-binding protein